ncbi:MAG: endonuclease domain-containing protein [Bacteroidaceae bacterium]|nr:endonuclease domain-containing protein [Bacteroidaceae bacterium]
MIDFRTSSPDRYRILKDFARENRKNMTEAESVLWNSLRNKNLGVKFLRQHIIGDYIVDFVCQETGLIIEVDGGYHSEPCQKEDDDTRTRYLESKGFKVIRFTNEEILFNIESVINKVYNLIK